MIDLSNNLKGGFSLAMLCWHVRLVSALVQEETQQINCSCCATVTGAQTRLDRCR